MDGVSLSVVVRIDVVFVSLTVRSVRQNKLNFSEAEPGMRSLYIAVTKSLLKGYDKLESRVMLPQQVTRCCMMNFFVVCFSYYFN